MEMEVHHMSNAQHSLGTLHRHPIPVSHHSSHLALNGLYPTHDVKLEPIVDLGQTLNGGISSGSPTGSPPKIVTTSPCTSSPMPVSVSLYEPFDSKLDLLHHSMALPPLPPVNSLPQRPATGPGSGRGSKPGVLRGSADRKRPYPCDTCSSRFGSKMELEEHQNSHTGQKPFECDVCQSRFNRRSTLWNHKRIHSDAKPFSCTVCQMTFKWKNSLKCHKEMHMRKNETTAMIDNDIKMLTYATAAKKKLAESQNGVAPNTAIQTTSAKKKNSGSKKSKRVKVEMLENANSVQLSMDVLGQMEGLSGVAHHQLNRNLLNDHASQQMSASMGMSLDSFEISNIASNPQLMQAICAPSSSIVSGTQLNQIGEESLEFMSLNGLDAGAQHLPKLQHSSVSPQHDLSHHNVHPSSNDEQIFGHNDQLHSNFVHDFKQEPISSAASTMQSPLGSTTTTPQLRLPIFNTMGLMDFQQLAGGDRQSQQLQYNMPHVVTSNSQEHTHHSSPNSGQNPMLGQWAVLDDVQHLYQQSIDPALLLHHQQAHMDYVHNPDYMLSGAPIYNFAPSAAAHSLESNGHFMPNGQMNGMTSSQHHRGAEEMHLDEMGQHFTHEDLQSLAKMLPQQQY